MCSRPLSHWFLFLLLAGCHKTSAATESTRPPEPPIEVSTAEVKEQPMPRWLTLTGTLAPNEASEVAANASGAVLITMVERGTMVQRGDVLARLDARTAALSANEASASVGSAQTQLELARVECERVEKLKAAGAITGAEYDRQRGACESAQWAAKAAEARLATARKGLGDSIVRAPFAGMVADRYVSAGEYVQPSTRVVRLVAVDPLRLELVVPESSVSEIRQGLQVDFKVTTYPDQVFRGSVRYVGPSLRAASRDLLVEAVVPNTDGKLRPGMFAVAKVNLGDAPALVVPAAALRSDGISKRLFAVRTSTPPTLEERIVKVGSDHDGWVTIETGVAKGERVVAPVGPEVHDGAKVR